MPGDSVLMLVFGVVFSVIVIKLTRLVFTFGFFWTFGTLFFLADRGRIPIDVTDPPSLIVFIAVVTFVSCLAMDMRRAWKHIAKKESDLPDSAGKPSS